MMCWVQGILDRYDLLRQGGYCPNNEAVPGNFDQHNRSAEDLQPSYQPEWHHHRLRIHPMFRNSGLHKNHHIGGPHKKEDSHSDMLRIPYSIGHCKEIGMLENSDLHTLPGKDTNELVPFCDKSLL